MTFKEWFEKNLGDYAKDIANHGADAGWPHISYTSDAVDVYNQFEDEIYEMLNEDAESFGHDNVEEMISHFSRADMLSWPDGRKNLLPVHYRSVVRLGQNLGTINHCGRCR